MVEMRFREKSNRDLGFDRTPRPLQLFRVALWLSLWISLVAVLSLASAGRSLADVAAWERYSELGRESLRAENYPEAQSMFEAALREAEQISPWDIRVGRSLNDLAATYYAQGRNDAVAELLSRSLRVIEIGLGQDHPDVAQVLKNLAAVQYLQGGFTQAEENLVRALKIWEASYGPEHQVVAATLNNLAGIYEAQSKHAEAADALERSLRVWEKIVGPDHEAVAESRRQLAELRRVHGLLPPPEPDEPAAQVAAAGPALDLNKIQVASPAPAPPPQPAAPQAKLQVAAPAPSPVQPAVVPEPAALPAAALAAAAPETIYLEPAPQPGAPARVAIEAPASGPAVKVHLASYRSAASAEDSRSRLRDAFRDLLAGEQELWVERVETGTRGDFFRVMAGPFDSASAAQGFCSRLQRQDCFPRSE